MNPRGEVALTGKSVQGLVEEVGPAVRSAAGEKVRVNFWGRFTFGDRGEGHSE